MKILIILSAIFAATFAYPSGPGYYRAHQAPAVPATYAVLAQASLPVASTNIYAPAAPPRVNIPVVTGTLYHAQDTLGQYNFGYSSSDGQAKKESKSSDGSIDGEFNFISPEGQNVKLSYRAGKGGFVASGDHLPQQVELPEELAQAYQEANERLAKAHEEARLRGDVAEDDGQYREQASEHIGVEQSQDSSAEAQGAGVGGGYGPVAPPAAAPAAYAPVAQYAPVAVPQYAVVPQYAAPAPVQEVQKEVPYVASSYQTELGAPVALPAAPAYPSSNAGY